MRERERGEQGGRKETESGNERESEMKSWLLVEGADSMERKGGRTFRVVQLVAESVLTSISRRGEVAGFEKFFRFLFVSKRKQVCCKSSKRKQARQRERRVPNHFRSSSKLELKLPSIRVSAD